MDDLSQVSLFMNLYYTFSYNSITITQELCYRGYIAHARLALYNLFNFYYLVWEHKHTQTATQTQASSHTHTHVVPGS